ncbi:MAG: hydrogenase nickel incorporation protein HypB [Treponema sp.]|nr:hydrogenase nickel incorporation protein HypB [Treponema sp.]
METEKIDVMESVFERNEKLAAEFNRKLEDRRLFCVNVLGAPGVGKTVSLQRIISGLYVPSFVIEGDIESDIDTRKLRAAGIKAAQINTGGACHLDAPVVADAFEAASGTELQNFANGFLFIENIGNLVCPAEFMIGEHIKLLVSSVTEGSDKPWKYPLAFEKAEIILLNKMDLVPYVDFDWDFYLEGIRKLNPSAPVFKVSGKTGRGYAEVAEWLTARAKPVLK